MSFVIIMPAEGDILPPIAVSKGLRNTRNRIKGTERTISTLTPSGKPTSDTFMIALREVVAYKERESLDEVLLLLDNSSTHKSYDAIVYAAMNKIVLHGLPPNSTAVLQPLDVGLFDGLKQDVYHFKDWQEGDQVRHVCLENLPMVVERVLTKITRTATDKGDSVGTRGFRDTGICPFNRNAIADEMYAFSDEYYKLSEDDEAVEAARAPLTAEEALKVLDDVMPLAFPAEMFDAAEINASQARLEKITTSPTVYTSKSYVTREQEEKAQEAAKVQSKADQAQAAAQAKDAKKMEVFESAKAGAAFRPPNTSAKKRLAEAALEDVQYRRFIRIKFAPDEMEEEPELGEKNKE